ncbi:hypothetical protein V8C34DRAFT_8960 [Trichoderma compactum]
MGRTPCQALRLFWFAAHVTGRGHCERACMLAKACSSHGVIACAILPLWFLREGCGRAQAKKKWMGEPRGGGRFVSLWFLHEKKNLFYAIIMLCRSSASEGSESRGGKTRKKWD